MNLTKRQQEIAETRLAEALGRPVKRCPSCGAHEAHWVPASLAERGHYICEGEPA